MALTDEQQKRFTATFNTLLEDPEKLQYVLQSYKAAKIALADFETTLRDIGLEAGDLDDFRSHLREIAPNFDLEPFLIWI